MVQRLDLEKTLSVHKGCVNSIQWNQNGTRILSGSDDQKLVISDPFSEKALIRYTTVHRSNIFSAKFLPQSNDKRIVSCAGDGSVLFTDLDDVNLTLESPNSPTLVGGKHRSIDPNLNFFSCHTNGTAYEILTIPNERNCFLSCGEDSTVRYFDLRLISKCSRNNCRDNILILSPGNALTTMSLSPISLNYLAVGCSDSNIRIFDRRYLKLVEFPEAGSPTSSPSLSSCIDAQTMPVKLYTLPMNDKRSYRVTSVVYSRNEQELLVSYSSDYLYLFDLTKDGVVPIKPIPKPSKSNRRNRNSPKVMRKLRLRGDWSDTGPTARPEGEDSQAQGQMRPQLQSNIMQRMTGLLSRMWADSRSRGNANLENDNENNFAESFSILLNDDPSAGPSNAASNPSTSANNDNSGNSGSSSSDEDDVDLKNLLDDVENSLKQCDYVKQKYLGHRNARTMIKEANFWGDDFIMCGSGENFQFFRKDF